MGSGMRFSKGVREGEEGVREARGGVLDRGGGFGFDFEGVEG